MSILSNYTPDCAVKVSVECPVEELGTFDNGTMSLKNCPQIPLLWVSLILMSVELPLIIKVFLMALMRSHSLLETISELLKHVVKHMLLKMETTNHFQMPLLKMVFSIWMNVPLAVGTVGGLTNLHPLAKRSLEMLGNPSSKERQLWQQLGLSKFCGSTLISYYRYSAWPYENASSKYFESLGRLKRSERSAILFC